ncbi:stage V sporulation protein E [Gracilibacillus halophilus YIM-C55.5]|uniref:Probable peptidoglycan glycosyltransferase FtsW n=1 Tax=Gracilibacillus halophilus YIM-C55.5 TaxID=1308866 RepID=N4WQF4_9BACI|nr:putative lipid II flippase FtsW [Gracilibacillus halophilus]ENH98362.1 stage V sporulation protein E [Gracilibacillus halophilus YIM-C55.5]
MRNTIKSFDFTLMIIPLLLAGFGIVMIYSASMVTSLLEDNPANDLMVKQLIWFCIGLVLFVFTSFFKYTFYQKMMKLIVLTLMGLLISVLIFGSTFNNSTSWIEIGPFSLQPSEFVKIGLIIYLAAIYAKKQEYISDFFKGVLPPLVVTSILLGLIIMQPDIGTAGIVFAVSCVVIFSSGVRWKHLSFLIITAVTLLLALSFHLVTDERLSRFVGAYQPFSAPEGDGYQLIQSYIAIGTGGITGQGLGQGVQKLGYLTQAESDFIMAVIAEELGFIGVSFVLTCLLIMVLRGMFIAWKCEDSFGSLLAIGISGMVGIQSIINLGAISGLLPITGVPLPFVSYGGSSLIMFMMSLGILNNIARHVKHHEYHKGSYHLKEEENIKSNIGMVNQAKNG